MASDAVRPPKNPDSNNTASHPSASKFVGSGLLLFVDRLLVAITNWVFWLVMSRFASTSQIGDATAIASLVMLVTLITQLGLEYPLLKLSSSNRSQIFGTALAIKTAVTIAAAPIMVLIITNFYGYPLQHEFVWISVATLLAGSLSYVARFALLGISNVKYVLAFEVIGTIIKFASGYILVSMGYGTLGILISFLSYTLAASAGLLFIVRKSFPFSLGDRKFFKQITREGLLNTPSKLSKMFIINLSVVLLASLAIGSEDVGIFYIALMISTAVGSFAASVAFMVIPASAHAKRDLTVNSTRIGLSLTVPFITAIIVSPGSILSLVGHEYVAASDVLFVLGIGILPSIIGLNAISQFNTTGRSNQVLLIGVIQIIAFLVAFAILVPQYGTLGAAYSILISFIASIIPFLIRSEQAGLRYIAYSIVAIITGWVLGKLIGYVGLHDAIALFIASAGSFAVIILLRNISFREIYMIIRSSGLSR